MMRHHPVKPSKVRIVCLSPACYSAQITPSFATECIRLSAGAIYRQPGGLFERTAGAWPLFIIHNNCAILLSYNCDVLIHTQERRMQGRYGLRHRRQLAANLLKPSKTESRLLLLTSAHNHQKPLGALQRCST